MKDGYIRSLQRHQEKKITICSHNGPSLIKLLWKCMIMGQGGCFPGALHCRYTCQDLFWQDQLIAAAEDELIGIADYSRSLDGIFSWGFHMR